MKAMILLLGFLLAGCGGVRTVMMNKRGEKITCESRGWGLLSTIVADRGYEACISAARQEGYQILEEQR
ncbi:MAG TPA: hypothetical protein VNN77_04435 [candidate division Zixibacteria bacterium]|nr:hypothetical protein [candidate division Zixibacteria bacterium]